MPGAPRQEQKNGLVSTSIIADWSGVSNVTPRNKDSEMGNLAEVNQILNKAADSIKKLELDQQVFMVVGLIESLDEPSDQEDVFVNGVCDALCERLEIGGW